MQMKIKAAELQIGDCILWRTGNAAKVISVEIQADCVYVVCGGSIHIYDRKLNKNKVITIERNQATKRETKIHPYQSFYNHAVSFLNEHLPDGMTERKLNRYFLSDEVGCKNVSDIFERFIISAQNYQSMPNVIKFAERKEVVKKILYNYDLDKILKNWDAESLYRHFRKMFKVSSADTRQNSWFKWSNSIIDSAKFLNEFNNVDKFKQFVGLFKFNVHTRMALPLLISHKIKGVGFALACDALKELGLTEYPKPDVHLLDIFSSLGLKARNEIAVFETIVKISEKCRETDKSVTPYKIDKILWLICSGRYYHHNIETKSYKKEFIESLKSLSKPWQELLR